VRYNKGAVGHIDIFPKRCCERTGESCLRRSSSKTCPSRSSVAKTSVFQESGCNLPTIPSSVIEKFAMVFRFDAIRDGRGICREKVVTMPSARKMKNAFPSVAL
jgi:hypothetical protein